MGAKTNYLENKDIDFHLRNQAYSPPANVYIALFTVTPDETGGGTEVSGGGYARVAVARSLVNWAGTQGAGTTTVSTGTSGTTSNNNPVTFPPPSADWGVCVAFALFDNLTGGDMERYAALDANKTINNGDPAPFFAAGTLIITEDT